MADREGTVLDQLPYRCISQTTGVGTLRCSISDQIDRSMSESTQEEEPSNVLVMRIDGAQSGEVVRQVGVDGSSIDVRCRE